MSWLSDLADKAENLLNKIDQNAAAVLQEKEKSVLQVSRSAANFEPQPTKGVIHSSSLTDIPSKSFTLGDEALARDVSNTSNGDDRPEKFDMENAMLKNEISLVHNELALLLSKTKAAEKITQDAQSRFTQMESSYNRAAKENEELRAKISSYENRSDGLSSEEDERISSHWESEKKSSDKRIKQLECTINSLTSAKKDLEADLASSREMCATLEEKLEKSKVEASNLLEEWKTYKIRVNNTLSMKEKMIETLGGSQELGENETIPILNEQIAHLKTERDEMDNELDALKSELDVRCKEVDRLELNLRSNERQLSQLRESLRQEKSAREVSEHAVDGLAKELQGLQSETAKQIAALRGQLKEARSAPTAAEKQTSEKLNLNSSFGSAESGEDRFRSLTQALVAKQAALESVTADRNALRLQLEKTETKYRSDLVNMKNNQPRIINFNYTDDVKEQFPSLLRESPWDSRLSRKVKKAYSSLDSFSVRIGVFLRRNPIARIFIIAYMIILHLWVLIVLCTYTPEVHPGSK